MSNVAIAAPDPTMARDSSRFSCRRFDTAGTVRVAVAGELDMATVPELEGMLRHARADARLVVLDLRELEFIDSSGVHLLLAATRRAREAGGRLLVARGAALIDRLSARPRGRLAAGADRELVPDRPPHPVLRRATRAELSHDISLRSAGRVCRALVAATELSPRATRRPPPPRRRVAHFHGANRHQTIFKESSVMSTLAAASIGTSPQRALNGPLRQRDRRPPGGLRAWPRRLTDRTANES